ncbi:hypothetical protein AYI68_g4722 [Smittium mucronatum]|uniref:Uncharacterized protein n=1 Tax=Smittium mucronatum TaxID=133383 RepID=A0A1R0GWC5_9FUNG|nr:hypothetical protein AYI68_g4722 [Smittium mucronatum]
MHTNFQTVLDSILSACFAPTSRVTKFTYKKNAHLFIIVFCDVWHVPGCKVLEPEFFSNILCFISAWNFQQHTRSVPGSIGVRSASFLIGGDDRNSGEAAISLISLMLSTCLSIMAGLFLSSYLVFPTKKSIKSIISF